MFLKKIFVSSHTDLFIRAQSKKMREPIMAIQPLQNLRLLTGLRAWDSPASPLDPTLFAERVREIENLFEVVDPLEGMVICLDRVIEDYLHHSDDGKVKKAREKLLDLRSRWLLSGIKVHLVVLWALLNQGDFRENKGSTSEEKIQFLREKFKVQQLEKIGDQFFDQGFYFVANQFYRAALVDDNPYLHNQIGRCYYFFGEYDQAFNSLREANLLFSKPEFDPCDERLVTHLIYYGDVCAKLRLYDEAIAQYKRALEGSQELGKEGLEASISLSLAQTLEKKQGKRSEESIGYFESICEQFEDFGGKETRFQKWMSNQFTSIELRYQFLKGILDCRSTLKDLNASLSLRVGEKPSPFMKGLRKKCITLVKEAHPTVIRIFYLYKPENHSTTLVLAQSYFVHHPWIAKIHKMIGCIENQDFIKQSVAYQNAILERKLLVETQQHASVIDQRVAYHRLGKAYRDAKRTFQARDSFLRALQGAKRWDDSHPMYQKVKKDLDKLEENTGGEIGSIYSHPYYMHLDQSLNELVESLCKHFAPDDAVYHAFLYLVKNINLDDLDLRVRSFRNAGWICNNQEQYQEAVQYFLQANDLAIQLSFEYRYDILYRLAESYRQNAQYPQAIRYFAEALTFAIDERGPVFLWTDYPPSDVKSKLNSLLKHTPQALSFEESEVMKEAGQILCELREYTLAEVSIQKMCLGYGSQLEMGRVYLKSCKYFNALAVLNDVLDGAYHSGVSPEEQETLAAVEMTCEIFDHLERCSKRDLLSFGANSFGGYSYADYSTYHEIVAPMEAADSGGYPIDRPLEDFPVDKESIRDQCVSTLVDSLIGLAPYETPPIPSIWKTQIVEGLCNNIWSGNGRSSLYAYIQLYFLDKPSASEYARRVGEILVNDQSIQPSEYTLLADGFGGYGGDYYDNGEYSHALHTLAVAIMGEYSSREEVKEENIVKWLNHFINAWASIEEEVGAKTHGYVRRALHKLDRSDEAQKYSKESEGVYLEERRFKLHPHEVYDKKCELSWLKPAYEKEVIGLLKNCWELQELLSRAGQAKEAQKYAEEAERIQVRFNRFQLSETLKDSLPGIQSIRSEISEKKEEHSIHTERRGFLLRQRRSQIVEKAPTLEEQIEKKKRGLSYCFSEVKSRSKNIQKILCELGSNEEALEYQIDALDLELLENRENLKQSNGELIIRHISVGETFFQLGRYEEALEYYQKALRLEREDILSRVNPARERLKQCLKDEKADYYLLHLLDSEEQIDYVIEMTGENNREEARLFLELFQGDLSLLMDALRCIQKTPSCTFLDYRNHFNSIIFDPPEVNAIKERVVYTSIDMIQIKHNCEICEDVLVYLSQRELQPPILFDSIKGWFQEKYPQLHIDQLQSALHLLQEYFLLYEDYSVASVVVEVFSEGE